MSKAKNVDSIAPTVVIKGKDQYRTQPETMRPDEPLLSILKPTLNEQVHDAPLPNVEAKENFLKNMFAKKVKPAKEVKEKKAKPLKVKKVSNFAKATLDKKAESEKSSELDSATLSSLVTRPNDLQVGQANPGISSGPSEGDPRIRKDDSVGIKKPKWSWFTKKEKIKPQIKKDESPEKNGFIANHKRLITVSSFVLGILLLLSAIVGGVAYAHQSYYANKVYPGVVVWGENVGGKTMPQVQDIIASKIKKYNVVLKGPDQDYKATAAELGVFFDPRGMARSAFALGRSGEWYNNYLTRAKLALSLIKWDPLSNLLGSKALAIHPSYELSQDSLSLYISKISDNIKIDPQDSQVIVDGGSTQLKPAIYGRKVLVDELRADVLSSINALESKKITVKTESLKPAIVDTAAQEVMLQAQNVMARPVVLTYNGNEYRPNQETVASWISFTKATGDSKYTLVIDQSKMSSYFAFLQSKIDIHSTPQIVRVENGVKQTETQAGVNGLLVDTRALGAAIAAKLPVQPSISVPIPTYVDVFKTQYNNVIVADWAKYIDINLSTQTMMACEKGGVNCRQWLVTTGDDNHTTPTGSFLVLGKSAAFYMTGFNADGSQYKLWVDHATWFTSAGHAIHDAYWRHGSFGGQDYHYNGSHGCINSPDDASTFIYNWADVGTPVTIHY